MKMAIKKKQTTPNLNTILMVEDTLENMDESAISVAELKRILPRKVNHNTLKVILDYLLSHNRIVWSSKGITWIVNDSPKLIEAIRKGTKLEDLPKID